MFCFFNCCENRVKSWSRFSSFWIVVIVNVFIKLFHDVFIDIWTEKKVTLLENVSFLNRIYIETFNFRQKNDYDLNNFRIFCINLSIISLIVKRRFHRYQEKKKYSDILPLRLWWIINVHNDETTSNTINRQKAGSLDRLAFLLAYLSTNENLTPGKGKAVRSCNFLVEEFAHL